jgi:hypothetical protein
VSLAVLVVTVAQVLDLGTILHMIARRGLAAEANPFVAHMLAGEGLPFVVIAKIAGLALVVAVIAVLAGRDGRTDRRLAGAVAFVAIVAGIIGGLTNAGAINGHAF